MNDVGQQDEHDGADTVADNDPSTSRSRGDGTHLKELLYYIAEDQSRLNGYVHRGVMCNGCYMKPIRGVRWRCANCADYDLCSECEAMGMHSKTHIFYKVTIPAPFLGNPRQALPVVYPGIPERMPRELPVGLSRRLADETSFDKEEVDALYDQFTCLANAAWKEDPNGIKYAIDRTAFDTAFVPLTSSNAPQPNLLYDRIFAFYDANSDGLIGFEELLKGLSYVQRKSPDERGRRRLIFNGFDIDDDGFISRKDVLRLFRAYYTIQKDITHDLVAVQEEDSNINNIRAFLDTAQPLSAIFTEPAPPAPDQQVSSTENKPPNVYGDRRTNASVIYETSKDEDSRHEVIKNSKIISTTPGEQYQEAKLQERFERHEFYTDLEEGWGDVRSRPEIESEVETPIPQRTPLGLLRSASIWHVDAQDNTRLSEVKPQVVGSSISRMVQKDDYNVHVPPTDMSNEILYQVIQEGLNEMLDPIFKAKENLAMEVKATAEARDKWRTEVMAAMNALDIDSIESESNHSSSHEKPADLEPLNKSSDFVNKTPVEDNPMTMLSKSCGTANDGILISDELRILRDPTLPQFRPNSIKEMLANAQVNDSLEFDHGNPALNKGPVKTDVPPTMTQLKRYFALDQAEQDIDKAGGPGRLNFEEFDVLMRGEKSRALAFVDSWFELGSF